jgi:predicted MPP superfamily phosphohydrolase
MYPYVAGRYAVNGMTLIVSRGTGFWGPPMRLFKRAELTLITLTR